MRNLRCSFSANCMAEMKQKVHELSGIEVEALVEKYLGLPTALGRSIDNQFEHIVSPQKKKIFLSTLWLE